MTLLLTLAPHPSRWKRVPTLAAAFPQEESAMKVNIHRLSPDKNTESSATKWKNGQMYQFPRRRGPFLPERELEQLHTPSWSRCEVQFWD